MADGRLAIFAGIVTLLTALSPAVAADEEGAAEVEESAAESELAGLSAQASGVLAPPFLEGLDGIVTKGGNWSIDPANWTRTAAIKVRGSVGGETEARVKIRVEGKGSPAFVYPSQQTVIAIQDSGAMATNDPAKERVDGAATYIDQMRNASQVSVIRFPRDNNNAPVLLIGLTANYSAAKNVLNPATFNNTGSTPLRDALHMANNVLATNRLPGFTQNIVLMSNGCATIGGSAWPEVNRSKNESIRVFTVGLYEGNGSTQKQQCEPTMRSWANATGGTYLWMRNATEVVQVHTEVERLLTDIAGLPPGGGSAMVSVKMTDDIEVVPGSWVCDAGKCADPAPDNASGIQNGNKGIFINWSAPASSVRVGEVWQVEFGVHSYTLGTGVKVNDAAVSRVRYTGYDGSTGKVDKIEQLLVDVSTVCPSVCVDRVEIAPSAWPMKIGETKQFGAVAYDQNNNTIPGAQWTWSSTGSIGTVNSTGLFTATAAGGGQVVARASYNGTNGSGTADVTVTDPSAGAPYVTSTAPAANAVDVFPGTSITIYWNESMDAASAEGATSISPTVTCAWSWATPVHQKCVPTLPLATFVKHDVTVSTSAKDSTGVAMKSPFTFSFTTGGPGPAPTVMQSNPADGALRVPRATPIQVMF
ncbi:MAG TPA: Ig-like domain-containing protein, partial [Thermoplasmata archaeon]|nr:Ig-like domain-containing protein [Thermoplasmata archaeon]